jgi:hypothetical protein
MKINLLAAAISAMLMLLSTKLPALENTNIKIEASRALSLAVVDLDRKNPAGEQVADLFKTTLSVVLSQLTNMPSPVKPLKMDASRAGWGLGTGAYDAAVVIGGKVPRTMISAAFTIIRAMPDAGDEKCIIYLVIRNDDPGLARLLTESFPEVIKEPELQKILAQYRGAPESKQT